MDQQSLRSFITVAECHSFTLAAEQLKLTQPAISKRIASLEKTFDTQLFHRIGHNIQLTPAGEALYSEAKKLLQHMQFTHQNIRNLSGSISGPLHIATGHHIGLHRLPKVLKEFNTSHPDVDVNVSFMDSEEAYHGVTHGDIELALLTLPQVSHTSLQYFPIWENQLSIMCAHDYPLAQEKHVSFETLVKYPIILPQKNTFTYKHIMDYFNKNNLTLEHVKTGSYLENIKTLVECRLGWGILPDILKNDELTTLLPEKFQLKQDLGLIHHIKRPLSNAARAFLTLLKQNQ